MFRILAAIVALALLVGNLLAHEGVIVGFKGHAPIVKVGDKEHVIGLAHVRVLDATGRELKGAHIGAALKKNTKVEIVGKGGKVVELRIQDGHGKATAKEAKHDAKHGAESEKRGGAIIGEVKSRKDQGKQSWIEVLAPGEEKARKYYVMHDPKVKGPIPKVLAAVRAAQVGDRVEFEWVATGHGPAIRSFTVLKK